MTSPKAGIVLGPWYKTEFYGNAGYGLHSNDIRGATITVDPNDKVTALDRVPLLVRSRGAELVTHRARIGQHAAIDRQPAAHQAREGPREAAAAEDGR